MNVASLAAIAAHALKNPPRTAVSASHAGSSAKSELAGAKQVRE